MKAFNYILGGVALMGAMTMTSCSKDYLDTDPTTSVSDAAIISSVDNLYIALNGIHKEMVSQETGYQALGGLPGFMFTRDWQADDITCQNGSGWYPRFAAWPYITVADNGYNYSYYRVYYQWILNANKILEGLAAIDKNSLQSDDEKNLYDQIKGEALTFRAFAHYDLVQQYAKRYEPGGANSQDGVIYRESSEIGEQARESVANTYAKIEKDLAEAATLLKGLDVNDVNHFSEMSVYGIQARVALTKGEYAKAADYAEKAIASAENDFGRKLMSSNEEINNGFADITSKSKEAMYAAMTPDDKTVYFYSFMAYMSWNFNSSAVRSYSPAINSDLYATISETDYRSSWWDPTGTLKGPASNYKTVKYQNRKFTARATSNAVCDVAFMRLAEMYLIAAEGYARAGETTKAQTIFAKFQGTRDPEYTACTSTGDALVEEIMNSRRVELWGEGQRMFDCKRLNLTMHRDALTKEGVAGWITKDASTWVYEIPQHETDYNSLCTKNY